jgi:cell division protein FtsB
MPSTSIQKDDYNLKTLDQLKQANSTLKENRKDLENKIEKLKNELSS